ncbi:MAG: antitoxin Xre/MbcA/ParS toxin-binding domain-containing protein [Candidatus Thiodiazotropha endolucinida]
MYTDAERMDQERVATAALQGFFNITERWGLTAKQQRTLLGEPAETTFFKWKSEKNANRLDSGTLERISCILGIHKALRILLPTEHAAYEWVKKPNDAPLFRGETALSRMLAGRVADLYEVRVYLDNELG